MSLDLSRIENVHQQGGKTIARCPACAEQGHDKKGEHLVIMEGGAFGCVTNPGEAGKSHRKRIFALAGEVRSWMKEGSGIRVLRPPEAGSCKPTNRTWQAGGGVYGALGTLGTVISILMC